MNNHPNENPEESWEMRVQENARHFEYPPTPDIAAAVSIQRRPSRPMMYRRLAQVAIAILIVFLALMAVPEIRAAVLEILRIGSVRIFQNEPTPRPSQTPRPTPVPTGTPLGSVLDLPGETTLETARSAVPFEISYPASLGQPERVFAQQMDDWQVVLTWQGGAISLHMMPSATFQAKYYPYEPVITRVNNSPALWFDQPHTFEFWTRSGESVRRTVAGNVLLWDAGEMTFRLESTLSLGDARRLAEQVG